MQVGFLRICDDQIAPAKLVMHPYVKFVRYQKSMIRQKVKVEKYLLYFKGEVVKTA